MPSASQLVLPRADDRAAPMSPAHPTRRVVLVAIILIAVNLRVGVTSVGSLLGEVGAGLRLNAVLLGVVTALPTAAFAAFGALTPALYRRVRPTALLAVAMILLVVGQLARVLTSSVAVFMVASADALAGVAVCNILLPMLVKRYFPDRIGLVTAAYTVAMVLSGTVAAAGSVPLAEAARSLPFGEPAGAWRIGLGVWALPALVALVPVLLVWRSRRDVPETGAGPVIAGGHRPIRVGRTGVGWALALFFGAQSFSGFAIMGWLPEIYQDAGFSGRTAGLLLAAVIGAGVPVAFAMPWMAARRSDQRPLVLILAAAMLVAYLGLAVAPRSGALLWTGLLAFGQGSFPLALALVGLRSRTSAGTVALSAFAQSSGYLLATVGPLAIGLLYHASGGWTLSIAVLVGALLVQVLAGLRAGRPGLLEDSPALVVVPRPAPGRGAILAGQLPRATRAGEPARAG